MADNTAEVQVDTEISTVDDAGWGIKGAERRSTHADVTPALALTMCCWFLSYPGWVDALH